MDQRDSELGRTSHRVDADRLAIEHEATFVGCLDAREDLHERALARAILTNQGQDLARMQLEVHVLQRDHAGEALRDGFDSQQRVGHLDVDLGVVVEPRESFFLRSSQKGLRLCFLITRASIRWILFSGILASSPRARAARILTDS